MSRTNTVTLGHCLALAVVVNLSILCVSLAAHAQDQQPEGDAGTQPPPPPPSAPPAPPDKAQDKPAAPDAQPPADADGGLTPEEEQALKDAEASKKAEAPDKAAPKGAAEAGSDEVSEEIVITGSRISRNKKEQFAQVAVISAKEIKASGATTLDDVLNKLPSLTLQGMNKQNNNGGNGLAFIDLRNLGSSRTLVLIDGKRFVSSGEDGAGVDMNNIPVAMIDRVEVLLDGASAIYGSDAIGGVVNIILKKNFEGVQVDVGGGLSTHKGDGQSLTTSATMGGKHAHGNAALSFTYMHQGEVWQKNRDWAKDPVTYEYYSRDENGKQKVNREYGSYYTSDGLIDIPSTWDTLYKNGDHWQSIYTPDYSAISPDFYPTMYNYGNDQWLIGRTDRLSLTTLADYKVNSMATAYMEGTYTYRKSKNQIAAQPLGGGTGMYPGTLPVPITNPYLPTDVLGALNGDDTVFLSRRLVEAGRRVNDNTANSFRLLAGLQGDFIKDRLGWDIYVANSRNQNSNTMRNAIDLARVYETLDPEACASNPNCPGLGNYFGKGKLQPKVLDYIRYDETTNTEWNMVDTGLALNSKLVQIPFGGWLAAVVGGEFRWEDGNNIPDGMVKQGYSAGNLQDPTSGSYNAQEFFAELSIPILKNKVAFHALTFDLAGRMSLYDTFGSQFTYRTGLSWAPIPDFTLRGVYSTAFRAPNIGELYGGSADSYMVVNDPCSGYDAASNSTLSQNCAASGAPAGYVQESSQIRTNVGSNPKLKSETANIVNAGIVITPTFIPQEAGDLVLSLDFYRITIDRAISALDPQNIVDLCYNSDGMSHDYCDYVGQRNSDGSINGIVATSLNISQIETRGLDLSASYMIPLPRKLAINLGWDGNVLLMYDEKNEAAGETETREGTIDFNNGSYAKYRWILSVGLGGDNWNYTNRLRYIGEAAVFSLKDDKASAKAAADQALADGTITQADYQNFYADLLPPTKGVDAVAYWDMAATYDLDSWEFVLGLDNVLDQDPPFLPEGGQNANIQTYDFMGRYVYANVTYKL
jgi:iron complex outermembrane recepter protein